MLQQVTEVFGLSHLIGTTPKAPLFQFSFCMLLYNMMQVVRGYVAQSQFCEATVISSELMFRYFEKQLITWETMVSQETSLTYFECASQDASTVTSTGDNAERLLERSMESQPVPGGAQLDTHQPQTRPYLSSSTALWCAPRKNALTSLQRPVWRREQKPLPDLYSSSLLTPHCFLTRGLPCFWAGVA